MDIPNFGLFKSQSFNCSWRTKSVFRREPENQNHRIASFDSLKWQNISDYQFLDSKFVVGRAKRGTRNNLYMLKSVIVAEKAVESEGRKTEGDLKSHYYDAIFVGSGIGGLVVATQLAVKGAKVLVLEKYVIPRGSSGFYQRDGFTIDVGSSVMVGFSDKMQEFLM